MAVELGERLAAEGQRLRLLVEHLAGRAVRARVEPEDLVQEVYLRALARPADAPPEEPGEAALRRWLTVLARSRERAPGAAFEPDQPALYPVL